MKKIGATLFAVSAIFAGACGDDSGSDDNNNDADADNNDNDADADDNDDIVIPDASSDDVDAPIDGPTLPAGCDWAELNDVGNGANAAGAWELTQASVTASYTACGTFNNGHFEPAEEPGDLGVVDQDAYQVSLAATGNIYLSLSGTGLETAPNAQFAVFDLASGDAVTFGLFLNEHASAAALSVPAGDYLLLAGVYDTADAPGTSTYKLRITVEADAATCPAGAGAATLTETDGANNTGNDTFSIAADGTITLTPGADAPNTVTAAIAAGANAKIAGTAATQNAITTDTYYDIDTYEFTTGPAVNEGRVRLDWGTTAPPADLDMYVYEKAGAAVPTTLVAFDTYISGQPEYGTAGLKPNTTYQVIIGGYMPDIAAPDAAADGFPRDYTVQVCASTFTAP